jgi:hypothetical protein
MNLISQALRAPRLPKAAGLVAVLFLAACASTPPAPTASLQAAKQAISEAERADASRYAPEEIGDARNKLAFADTAVSERKMIIADRLAQESRAAAELASARTTAAKATAVNEEMKHGTETLIEEMQRSGGDKP